MYIRVIVTPKAKKEVFKVLPNGTFSIAVKEPAERNLANRRVLELVGGHFGINPKQIRIISGVHGGGKLLSIPDTAEDFHGSIS